MAKSIEELNILKNELETVTNKLKQLTEEELNLVTGGEKHIVYTRQGAIIDVIGGAELKAVSSIAEVKSDRIEILRATTKADPAQFVTKHIK